MAKLLKLRRGTTTQHSSFTGAEGECTVDTTKDTLVVHDGSTAGGRPLLRQDLNNIVAGSITHAMLEGDAIDGDNIGDDVVNSEHIAAGAVDLEHMSANSVDSDQYVDGSIDHVHLAGDCIDGDNIQDDVINSEHIAAGAVDLEHMASQSVDEDNLYISNAGSNGQFLQKQSGNDGGLTWATVTTTPEGTAILSTGESGGTKYLREDGDGTCSWQSVSAGATGGSTDKIFWENGQTVTANYEIGTSFGAACNALSAGPVAINSGVTVTIASGDYWTIV